MNSIKGFADTIDWYNKHAKEFAQKAGSGKRYAFMEEFEKLLPKGAKLLDAGCGSGRDANDFQTGGFDVTGLDLATELIEHAKQTYSHCKFLLGDIRSLPFKENDFDGVWSNASLLHFETLEDVKKSLQEFYRVLKEKGIVFVGVKLQTGDKKTGLEEDARFTEPRFFQYFTEKEIHELLYEAGFTILASVIEQSKSRANVKWIQVIARKN